ncbi:hypothetical protein [Pseudoxanthomonas dokdonensis]|uniref:DUF2147 domain-containing protein n=1 Tax=Pseudoxanthomonas dokdonensis TaxID=344882 RepID=A0A0R0CGV9_9GAMM|nr:hypothetical protein [Pseudoxanthomonas dokdonensis]KRG69100.1 hypothetical protein ABB29_11815 [Pseudoxanthomonas dokdonensis]
MRHFVTALMTACLLLPPVIGRAASPFAGTWQLVDGEYLDEHGQTIRYRDVGMQSLKVLDEANFSFTSMANGKFWSAGAGQYHHHDKVYIETPRYTSYDVPAGQRYEFRYQLQGDRWTNERWEQGRRVEREVWQRVPAAEAGTEPGPGDSSQ